MRQCVALSPTGEAPKGYVKTKQHNVKGSIKNKPSKDDRTRLKSHISWHAQTNHQTRQVFVPDADISVKSVKKTKGSPLNFYSRIVRYSPLVYPLAFQAASLAHNQGSTPVSAAAHHCQLYDYHDLGRQEYYTATWKEADTWMQLSA